jgi:hypothetical protein
LPATAQVIPLDVAVVIVPAAGADSDLYGHGGPVPPHSMQKLFDAQYN